MPTMAEILAGIQDEGSRKALEALQADAAAKNKELADLQARLQGKQIVDQGVYDGWKDFETAWHGGLKQKAENGAKAAKENEALKAEIAKLKPEAERAALLAQQAEGQVLDPDKVASILEKKFEGRFLTPEREKAIREQAVAEARKQVDFGSIPAAVQLVEKVFRAKQEFGVDTSAEVLADASQRLGGLDKAYDFVTKDAREARIQKDAADREAKYKADLAEARRQGADEARRAFESNTYVPEEAGGGGAILPMTPPPNAEKPLVDPQTYDPARGVLAAEGSKLLRKWESEGKFQKVM